MFTIPILKLKKLFRSLRKSFKNKPNKQMKTSNFSLFLVILFAVFFAFTSTINAQNDEPRKSPKASVSQTIGLDTEITINYGRPAARDRDIYWDIVPSGMAEGNKYSDNKPYPWRAGANENTTIEFSADLKINEDAIPKESR